MSLKFHPVKEATRVKKDGNAERVFSWADGVKDRFQGRAKSCPVKTEVDKAPNVCLVNKNHLTRSAFYAKGKRFIIILNHFLSFVLT